MRSRLIPDIDIAAFLDMENPDRRDAREAIRRAREILAKDTGIGDEDYRAIERALHRAYDAETPAFMVETLKDVFGGSPEPEPVRDMRR